MRAILIRTAHGLTIMVLLAVAGCGEDDSDAAQTDRPRVVVTTNILGDVVERLVGEAAEVEVIMPPNSNPHDFAPSARQAAAMREADLLVVNGLGFEEGLLEAVEGAEADGVQVFDAASVVEPIAIEEGGHEEHADEGEHEHEGEDPHFFTDPVRMVQAAEALRTVLADDIDGLDGDDMASSADRYLDELRRLDSQMRETLSAVPDENRVLVTNHEVFGYFAERYDFEVLGAIIPGGSDLAEPSPQDLAELAESVREEGVAAIFAETDAPDRLVQALASETGVDVDVVELFSESLGEEGSEGDSYIAMMRTNANRIAGALASGP